jgi:hypothetical protein
MGRADLIGNGKHQLIPSYQPAGTGLRPEGRRAPPRTRPFRTQHTGLPDAPVGKAAAETRGRNRSLRSRTTPK